MTLRTVDLTYRRRDYRIREPERTDGCSIRMSGPSTYCRFCARKVGASAKRFVIRWLTVPVCIPCVISDGLVIETPESIADRALAERDHSEDVAAQREAAGAER